MTSSLKIRGQAHPMMDVDEGTTGAGLLVEVEILADEELSVGKWGSL